MSPRHARAAARLLACAGVFAAALTGVWLGGLVWELDLALPLRVLALLLLVPTPALCVLAVGVLAGVLLRERAGAEEALAASSVFRDPAEPAVSCTGWKLASLATRAGHWWFVGTFHGHYDVRAVAHCSVDPTHLPPVPECSCGLHAFWTRDSARQYAGEVLEDRETPLVLVRVEAYGEVLTYEHGFRAESHDVVEVLLAPRCACGAPTTHLRCLPVRGFDEAIPACVSCAGAMAPDLASVSAALGIPCTLQAS